MRNSILIFCCICVISGSRFTFFRQYQDYNDKACLSEDKVFTDGNTSNLAKCVGLCSLNSSCRSIFFNEDSNLCHGCSRNYEEPTNMPSSPGTECFGKPANYEESCSHDVECVMGPYQGCFNYTCSCKPGYPPDPATNGCSTGCAVYGSEFQVYEFTSLDVSDEESWGWQFSPDGCKTHCASQPWCRSFDHSSVTMMCYFKSGTAATNPGNLNFNLIFFHYSRNCA